MERRSGRRNGFGLARLKQAGLFIALLTSVWIITGLAPSFISESAARSLWSETTPSLNLTHIFSGEINRRGKPVGFHVAPKEPMGATSRIKKILSKPNKAGIYTAIVEIYDARENRWKEKFSSFFPDDFSKEQIIESILFAIANNTLPPGARWRGPSGHGFLIEGYRFGDGDVNTAYPLYAAD